MTKVKRDEKKIRDVSVENLGGSIVFVRPLTDAAREWVNEHVELESWQWMGGAFAVEPRMLEYLLDGMIEDGLKLGD